MKRKYQHVLAAFYGSPWAILPAKLAEIEAVLWRWVEGGRPPVDEAPQTQPVAAFGDSDRDRGFSLDGSAAVIPIHGTIHPRASVFDEWSGGTSAEAVGRAVDKAVADTRAEHIVLDVDSPGGSIYGITTAAGKILAARKQKPVTAVVNHVAASGAYWLASQAGEVVIDPDGEVGSVGVIWPKIDETKLEEMLGIKTDLVVSTKSPFKGAMWPQTPQTAENRAEMLRQIDEHMEKFLAAVAKGRGVSAARVEKDFGQGRMRLAGEAISARMGDRIATLEQVVKKVNEKHGAKKKSKASVGWGTGTLTPADLIAQRQARARVADDIVAIWANAGLMYQRPASFRQPSSTEAALPQWRRAVHEAGHATVAIALGCEVRSAMCGDRGFVEYCLRVSSESTDAAVTLAGGLAELLFTAGPNPFVPGGTASEDLRILREQVTSNVATEAKGRIAAERILVENAAAVERIANRLVVRGYMTGPELVAVAGDVKRLPGM
jgi:signal peptide peptidase SppA